MMGDELPKIDRITRNYGSQSIFGQNGQKFDLWKRLTKVNKMAQSLSESVKGIGAVIRDFKPLKNGHGLIDKVQ